MASVYETLFASYASSILQTLERDYDEREILARLDAVPLEKAVRARTKALFCEYRFRWSVDAFTLGLHLGLSLREDRRPRS